MGRCLPVTGFEVSTPDNRLRRAGKESTALHSGLGERDRHIAASDRIARSFSW